MQEHTTKDQDFSKARRANSLHIGEGSRLNTPSADALRDVHMSLVRAEQNLYNLVQASQSNGSLAPNGFGYGTPAAFAGAFAPGYAPGFGPSPTMNGATSFGYGAPTTPWAPTQAPAIATPAGITYPAPATWVPSYPPTPYQTAPTYLTNPGRVPACDISDEGKQFVLQLDLPGLRADQVEVLCFEHAVVINALRESEADVASLVQSERGTTTLQRAITLPADIVPGSAKATLGNGVLNVVLPKVHPTEGPRRVKVQG
jgi:HSP20 family protein